MMQWCFGDVGVHWNSQKVDVHGVPLLFFCRDRILYWNYVEFVMKLWWFRQSGKSKRLISLKPSVCDVHYMFWLKERKTCFFTLYNKQVFLFALVCLNIIATYMEDADTYRTHALEQQVKIVLFFIMAMLVLLMIDTLRMETCGMFFNLLCVRFYYE